MLCSPNGLHGISVVRASEELLVLWGQEGRLPRTNTSAAHPAEPAPPSRPAVRHATRIARGMSGFWILQIRKIMIWRQGAKSCGRGTKHLLAQLYPGFGGERFDWERILPLMAHPPKTAGSPVLPAVRLGLFSRVPRSNKYQSRRRQIGVKPQLFVLGTVSRLVWRAHASDRLSRTVAICSLGGQILRRPPIAGRLGILSLPGDKDQLPWLPRLWARRAQCNYHYIYIYVYISLSLYIYIYIYI